MHPHYAQFEMVGNNREQCILEHIIKQKSNLKFKVEDVPCQRTVMLFNHKLQLHY